MQLLKEMVLLWTLPNSLRRTLSATSPLIFYISDSRNGRMNWLTAALIANNKNLSSGYSAKCGVFNTNVDPKII